jgi:8-oxo-dGTP diphosphatase
MRTAINAAIIDNKKILLVRKNQTWILPGGKPEEGESDLTCLRREISEELSGTKIKDIVFYRQFSGRSPHKNDILEARVYFAKLDGDLYSVREGDSILEAQFVQDFSNYKLSDITSKIIDSLKLKSYL